jgi:hypothetical protein
LSTLWHFACQLLSVVAKVISSVFCPSFRGEDISLAVLLFISAITSFASPVFPSFFHAFFLQRLAFPSIDVQAMLIRNRLSFL